VSLYAALILGIAPWAMMKLFTNLPPGFNGLAGVAAAGWGVSALLLVLDGIATPLAFMRKCVLLRLLLRCVRAAQT
jgi:hypothetical protein